MDRRSFLRAGIVAAGGGAVLSSAEMAGAVGSGISPYGSLDGVAPDENGIILPEGFGSRVVAVAGEQVGGTDYRWRAFPDGAGVFDDGEGGWYLAVNSEVRADGSGGVGAIHFGPDGEILDAYDILAGSRSNCAGGPTPWGTWLSCEEVAGGPGLVWECDPSGRREAVARPAMGLFSHEAAAVDPVGEAVYMTEDDAGGGLLYRFRPSNYPDLSSGVLEAAIVADDGSVTWGRVADPSGESAPTHSQVAGATPFIGGEGIWYHDGVVYFTTKSDDRTHALDVVRQRYEIVYEPTGHDDVLRGVDNVTVDEGSGDLFVAEDGDNMELVMITPDGEVAPFARVVGHEGSEITGPVLNPARDRLYFSSQRAPTPKPLREINAAVDTDAAYGGVTYEISGPFRGRVVPPVEAAGVAPVSVAGEPNSARPAAAVPAPTVTLAKAAGSPTRGGSGVVPGAAVAAVAAGGALVWFRARRRGIADEPTGAT